MDTHRTRSIAAVVLLATACSGNDAGLGTVPTTPAQRWEYTQLYSIGGTFLDTFEPGLTRPDGFDATGIELWNRYRDAATTLAGDTSESQAPVDELVAVTGALFAHVYTTGIADEMIARQIAASPAAVAESADVPFEAGRPVVVGELDAVLQRDGCAGIEDEYHLWLGQTTIDEIAGRASVFARYALDRAASAGCDWALTELVG